MEIFSFDCFYAGAFFKLLHLSEQVEYISAEEAKYDFLKKGEGDYNLSWIINIDPWPEVQCCGSASIIMRIRIRDPKNVHMDPDPDADPDPRG